MAGLVAAIALGFWGHRWLFPPAGHSCPIQLCDVTRQTGIAFVHDDGSSGRRYIIEAMSAGMATFDYDGDGLIDIYFLSGAPLPGATRQKPPHCALYKNLGGWKFQDVTDQAGVGFQGFCLGVAVADYDNDGHPDIYLNNYGPNVLYRNNGDGTFSDVTGTAGVANIERVGPNKAGAGAIFLDIDADGDLDLYVGNYLALDPAAHVPHFRNGIPCYPLPMEYAGLPDTLYRNNGDGTFTDISQESGIARAAGTAMGMVACDIDNDGDTDLFILNDVAANFCWQNDGTGRFEEVGMFNGLALNYLGDANASMGVDCGDFDNDGWPDFYMTCYRRQLPVLYRNLGQGLFEDVTLSTGAGSGLFAFVNWGCGLVDLDNDGDRDVYIANGHVEDNAELHEDTASWEARNTVLMNLLGESGSARFVNVSDQCGNGLRPRRASRGTCFDDLDNDGDLDVVVLNSRRGPTILRNDSQPGNHWIQIRLCGVKCNRDGVGSRVRVVAGQLVQIAEVHAGRGYQSHFGTRLHFGLGRSDRVDRIEVRWLGGGVDVLEDLAADQLITVLEGSTQSRL
ncbi:MAG: CRTAC1 family protein [Thermoguttaceae bacterium]